MLAIDTNNALRLDVGDLLGESIAVLGMTGSGKTNTAAVLIEELLPLMPMTIIDIEGEYWGLKEKYNLLVAGRSENCDLDVPVNAAADFIAFTRERQISTILDMSEHDEDAMFEFLLAYFNSLWRYTGKSTNRKPHHIVLEEAHEFIPQGARAPLKTILTRVALRGRKRGLGLISVSQRSAKVTKDVLTQAGLVFLHRVVHPVDKAIYADILPLTRSEVDARVNALSVGEALVFHRGTVLNVTVRPRDTFHAGVTPGLGDSDLPTLRTVDEHALAQLKQMIASLPENEIDPHGTAFQKRITLLEKQLSERDERIQQLEKEVDDLTRANAILRKVGVTLEQTAQPPPDHDPRNMSVQRIDTEQIVTAGGETPHRSEPGDPDSSPDHESDAHKQPYISPRALTLHRNRQRRNFEALLRRLTQMRNDRRVVLNFLTVHHTKHFAHDDIARYTGLAESTVKNALSQLHTAKLVSREGKQGAYRYTSSVWSEFHEQYPDLDVNELIESVFALETR